MNFEHLIFLIGIALVVYILINLSYSKEIYYFVPGAVRKTLYWFILWGVPLLGAIFIHFNKYTKPIRDYKEGNPDGGNAISSGFLEVDSVFNPGARNYIETIQVQKSYTKEQQKKAEDKDKNKSSSES